MKDTNKNSFFSPAHKAIDNAVGMRIEFLVLTAICAISVGLLIPAKPLIMDILLTFSISISGVVIFICLAAKKTSDLKGFASAVSIAAFLRLMTGITAAKLPMSECNGGLIIETISKLINPAVNFTNLSIFLALITVGAVIVFMMVSRSSIKVSAFNYQILPLKKAAIMSRLKLGLSSYHQTEMQNERLADEAKFFVASTCILKLIKSETIISILVITFSILFASASAISENTEIRMYLSGISGEFLIWLAQLIAISSAMPALTEKIFKEASVIDLHNYDFTANIKKVVNETVYDEKSAILNPEFAQIKPSKNTDVIEELTDEQLSEELQYEESFKIISEDEYEKIADAILNQTNNGKIIVLTAENFRSIPVNIAINTAIRLAFKNINCLLIDTDNSRQAVQKVFQSSENDEPLIINKPQKTCIENISILQFDSDNDKTNINISSFDDSYDKIIIYAPDYKKMTAITGLIESTDCIITFGSENIDFHNVKCPILHYEIGKGFL